MTQISLDKDVFNKRDFEKLVDKRFKQLINNQNSLEEEFTIDEFFQLYEELFTQIPREGDLNSHRYILNKEAEYLGVTINDGLDVQALLQEITSLRNDLLEANKTLSNSTIK
jgi:malate synthase